MKKHTLIGILVVLVALGGYLWWRMHPSEKRVVAKRVENFAECVSKPKGEGNIAMAMKMNKLPGFFADQVSIDVQSEMVDGTYDNSRLTSLVAQAHTICSSLALTLNDITVEIDGPDAARATFTASLSATLKSGGSQSETREVHATLKKNEGKWQFTRFDEEQVMVK